MTELSSQFYEPTLREHLAGFPPGGPGRYEAPAWVRTRVLDPETLRPLPPGARGLLAHLDLANAWTVSAVLTEDIGHLHQTGFVLEGRARRHSCAGAPWPPRSCSVSDRRERSSNSGRHPTRSDP
jgi:hypothetical protein